MNKLESISTHIFISTIAHGTHKGKLRIVECRESPIEGSIRCNYVGEKVVGIVDTEIMAIAARDAHAKANHLEVAPF